MDTFDRIEALIKERHISGAKMSRDLGFSNSVFTQWKQRKQKPSSEKLGKIADYFGVTVDYLLYGRTTGDNIKRYREEKGLTLEELSEKVGISADELASYEKDADQMHQDTLQAIADALDIPYHHFIWLGSGLPPEPIRGVVHKREDRLTSRQTTERLSELAGTLYRDLLPTMNVNNVSEKEILDVLTNIFALPDDDRNSLIDYLVFLRSKKPREDGAHNATENNP